MSYTGVGAPLGAYYEFSPHQVFQGAGEYYSVPAMAGLGSIADEFNAGAIWADCQAGAGPEVGPASPEQIARGKRCAELTQAGLNELGYGPITVDGAWGPQSRAAMGRFRSDFNLPEVGLIQQKDLVLMEEQLRARKKPGPGPKVTYTRANGQLVPVGKPGVARAGMATMGVLALAAIGGVALFARRKKRGGARR